MCHPRARSVLLVHFPVRSLYFLFSVSPCLRGLSYGQMTTFNTPGAAAAVNAATPSSSANR